ncbi:hypothetical protein L3Q82_024460 [Scortum barcoo]|uniref:Uncharacterized protein n=1 Tax=Scortum barcoo TaxID=214431 RepID=A0ACB8WQL0_9TELE|nr:hypothetical protein L3Q82_024460 [Scortum barcoo]
MSHREEASGKTQDTLEKLCLSAGLGTPRGPPGRAGGSVWEQTLTTARSLELWFVFEVTLLVFHDELFGRLPDEEPCYAAYDNSPHVIRVISMSTLASDFVIKSV